MLGFKGRKPVHRRATKTGSALSVTFYEKRSPEKNLKTQMIDGNADKRDVDGPK